MVYLIYTNITNLCHHILEMVCKVGYLTKNGINFIRYLIKDIRYLIEDIRYLIEYIRYLSSPQRKKVVSDILAKIAFLH